MELKLNWSEEKLLTDGRFMSTAEPNSDFWLLWRERKEEIKAAGFSVGKTDGQWIITRFRSEDKNYVDLEDIYSDIKISDDYGEREKTNISSEASHPVVFSNRVERKGWHSSFTEIGSIPSFLNFVFKNKNTSLNKTLSQTFLLENANRERLQDEDNEFISSLIQKILQRGSTPFCSYNVENHIVDLLRLNTLFRDLTDESDFSNTLKEKTLIIDELIGHYIKRSNFKFDDELDTKSLFDSDLERSFFFYWIKNNFGNKAQSWFTPQANIDLILKSHGFESEGNRRADFLFSHPRKTLFIELDGEEHDLEKKESDQERDDALASCGFEVIRIPNFEIQQEEGPKLEELKLLLSDALENNFESKYEEELLSKAIIQSSKASKLQYSLCLALKYGWFKGDIWTIRVKGADDISPFAVQDFLLYLDAYSTLYNKNISPQKIILQTDIKSFAISKENLIEKEIEDIKFDVSISIEINKTTFDHVVGESDEERSDFIVRSCFLPVKFSSKILFKSERSFISKDLSDDEVEENLNIFLKNIYRKKQFRDSQSKAIANLLRGHDTVVLLPTGAGKSFIYQLAGLLMPGSTIVIDPLVALMEDQVDGLNQYGIDKSVSISMANKSLENDINLISNGEYIFILHSPERLQTSRYRDALRSLSQLSLVNLAVLDEAHCVSEWGHDFRPAYLNVSKNIRSMCKDQDGIPPPIVALTGTASRSVLRDVLTDLEIDPEDENSLIRPESFNREELNFFVSKSDENAESTFKGTVIDMPRRFSMQENSFWKSNGDDTHSGVIFTPFVKGKQDQTVEKSLNLVRNITAAKTTAYAGSVVPGFDKSNWESIKRKNVREFKENDVPLLVSTKAYGMGIDKPNIRFTLHYGIPSSIEAFYQEAGRAGRDRKKSFCGIIFSEFSEERTNSLLDPSKTIEEIREEYDKINQRDDVSNQLFFHTNNFKGIEVEVNEIKEALSFLGEFDKEDKMEIPFKKISSDNEKILQRLTKVGALDDYEKEYGQRKYIVKINSFKLESGKDLLKKYVSSIAPGRLKEFTKELDLINFSSNKENIIALCSSYIKFTYDFIERARRSAIREMCLLARKSKNNEEIKQVIQDYLQEGASTESLEILLQQSNITLSDWFQRLTIVENQLDANELKGQVIRLLESYPDHPGLLYLRSMTELLTKTKDIISANNDLKYAVSNSIYRYSLAASDWDSVIYESMELLGSKSKDNIYFISKSILELVEERVVIKEDFSSLFQSLEELDDPEIENLLLIKDLGILSHDLEKSLGPVKLMFEDKEILEILR